MTSGSANRRGAPAAGRVVVAMSGGVDSSVSAALLVEQGWEVVGVSMRLWNGDEETSSGCCSLDDFVDARRVANRLGIPFYVMDFQDEFRRAVVEPFAAEYAAGRTPNPCVRCNQFVKFGSFWTRARELGATHVATGHYARIVRREDDWELHRGVDPHKDQSYFLFASQRAELAHTLYPVGSLPKSEVRALAARFGLPVANKADSQEVCFAPGVLHGEFVANQLGEARPQPGPIVDAAGTVLGRHGGVHTVTIGQRRGLGLSGGPPRWVTAIDAGTATVRVGGEEELRSQTLDADQANWLTRTPPAAGVELTVRIRSRHPGARVRVAEAEASSFRLEAIDDLRAVTPGQAAVLYDGDRVVGGGWIR